ncbi:MAG: hypothetical protein ABR548_08580 [Actinomycetota bacterium]|nr:hypothetical protein [Actinomycetota bacterium]
MNIVRKLRRTVLTVIGLAVLFALAPAATAFADVNSTHAACMGYEAAALSPPGSNDEAIGGVHDLKIYFDTIAPGTPSGTFFRFFASLHEHSHAGCDEALEGGGE